MIRNINKYNILKWYKMLTGKSILHVNQGVGKIYSKNEIKGYYNDLTEKVLKDDELYSVKIPNLKTVEGEDIIFPVAVFQYGLGAYDLYLLENKELYFNKFKLMAEWALYNQEESGAWNNFFYVYPRNPYSAMAQGEGASLLIRAYIEFDDERYLNAARKAIEFMLISIEYGGTTLYKDDSVLFKEYTHKPMVLNGWIFALFGLYDYVKISDDEHAKEVLNRSIQSIKLNLALFDNGFWSMYNTDGMITSPFYHDLHIAQLSVLYDLFNIKEFKEYTYKWKKYRNKWFNSKLAFIVKVTQKITEK